MKKQEILILLALILGLFIIGFLGKLTGNAVNQSFLECNNADFNADGKVDYVDKIDFAREYDLNYGTENYCGFLDLNEDRIINIADSHLYSEVYNQNYGAYTGACQKKLFCEEKKINSETHSSPVVQENPQLTEEKPNLINWIKELFKTLS